MENKSELYIRNRINILEQTIDAAAEMGLTSVSMRTIAKKAEMDTSTIYHYFKNKEELLYESILYINKCFDDEMMKLDLDDNVSDEKAFKIYLRFMFHYLRSKPNHASTMRQGSVISNLLFSAEQRAELFKQTTEHFRMCSFLNSLKDRYKIIEEFSYVVTFFCYMPIYDLALATYGPHYISENQLELYIDALWKSLQN
jgi:AcrR family transcriptional regulator